MLSLRAFALFKVWCYVSVCVCLNPSPLQSLLGSHSPAPIPNSLGPQRDGPDPGLLSLQIFTNATLVSFHSSEFSRSVHQRLDSGIWGQVHIAVGGRTVSCETPTVSWLCDVSAFSGQLQHLVCQTIALKDMTWPQHGNKRVPRGSGWLRH